MYTIETTERFDQWMLALKDSGVKTRLVRRLERVALGNLGDVKPVGSGVFEMREFFGAGWRMYYVQHGNTLILMLGGGNKATQAKDIDQAKELASFYTQGL
jgi:putative addiction module killer protein